MKEFVLSNVNELDTFDSYYGEPHIEEDYITIPYINMGLMKEHPLNSSNKLIHIDFCFLQIIDPKFISVYGRGIIKNEVVNYDEKQSRWYGGGFIGENSILDGEIEIQASDVYLIIPKDFMTSSKLWIPDYKWLKGKGNIPEEQVLNFFSKTSKIEKIITNFGFL